MQDWPMATPTPTVCTCGKAKNAQLDRTWLPVQLHHHAGAGRLAHLILQPLLLLQRATMTP